MEQVGLKSARMDGQYFEKKHHSAFDSPNSKSNMSSWHIVALRRFLASGAMTCQAVSSAFIISLSITPFHDINLLFFFVMHIK